jgi:adenylosuccinate synthase
MSFSDDGSQVDRLLTRSKIAVAYKDPQTGKTLTSFPADMAVLERAEMVYEEVEGWNQPTTHTSKYEDLPEKARAYIEFIEKFVGVPVRWIGTGPGREDMIHRQV